VYLQHEVVPIMQSGFLPPLAEGFERFIANPETRNTFDKMVHELTTGDVSGEFDTHPPLNERVAALGRLRVAPSAGTSDGTQPLLKNPEKHARLLLEHTADADLIRKLNAITWDDVADSVYAKEWTRVADAHVKWFGTQTVGNLPAGKKAYTEIGGALKNPGETIVGSEERLGRAAYVMTAGLGAALLRAGWKIETGPGRPIEMKNGDASLIPREVVGRLIENVDAYTEWKAKCDELGIAQIPLAGTTPSTA
jgi:hypothetical protein